MKASGQTRSAPGGSGTNHGHHDSQTGKQSVCLLHLLLVLIYIPHSHSIVHAGTTISKSPHYHSAILKNISDTYWTWKLSEFSKFATYRGIHDHDDRLEDYRLPAFDKRKADCESFLQQLEEIDEYNLPDTERQDLAVLKADLSYFISGYKWRLYGNLNPLNFLEGIHRGTSWIKSMRYRNEKDMELFWKRLRAYVKQIDQVIDLMKLAIQLNRTNHLVSMVKVPHQIQQVLDTPVQESMFYWPFKFDATTYQHFNESRWEQLKVLTRDLIETEIMPAMSKLKDFVVNIYMKNTRNAYGVGSFDNGLEYYQACLRFHLSTNISAAQVRDIGLAEVARIKTLMEEVVKRENFNGSLTEFFEYLRLERRGDFYDLTPDKLLQKYRDIVYDVINPKLSLVLKSIPEEHVRVEKMSHDGPSGSYGSGVFYVNLNRAHTRPTYTMMALALHESNPGHHLQTAFSQHQPLPSFRRYFWGTKYYAVPFNFPWYTAYTEGWGLYAEYLGEEMGCYNESALELFGRYSSEIFRACRLVVDTGIHAFGMSRQEAIDYLANHTAIPMSQIETEIDRYITWPGQACGYKMGELEILNLRNKASRELGDHFNVGDFNHEVLKVGRGPMELLEREIDSWIERERAASASSRPCESVTSHMLTICALLALAVQRSGVHL